MDTHVKSDGCEDVSTARPQKPITLDEAPTTTTANSCSPRSVISVTHAPGARSKAADRTVLLWYERSGTCDVFRTGPSGITSAVLYEPTLPYLLSMSTDVASRLGPLDYELFRVMVDPASEELPWFYHRE